jgi:hypothetical protein
MKDEGDDLTGVFAGVRVEAGVAFGVGALVVGFFDDTF